MKNHKTAYWIATGFVALIMTASGVLALIRAPYMMHGLAHLGYPVYFSDLLGVGKLAGVCVLLAPGMARLKEWAYVAFGITVLSATYSHFSSGDGLMALEPLVTFAALVLSYLTRPVSRRYFNQDAPEAGGEPYAAKIAR
jgi:DoxX-like family